MAQAEVFLKNSPLREPQPIETAVFSVSERSLELVMGYGLVQLNGGEASVNLGVGLRCLARYSFLSSAARTSSAK